MRQKITSEAIKRAAEGDAEEFNKQLESCFKEEESERNRAINAKSNVVLKRVPKASELPVGVTVIGLDGTTWKRYSKCPDGTVRSATIT